ncbi:Zinc finger, B-box [Plasmopara halstedii]|uniref:Zinc finger, B-box n=1 Tax=Plasmopara halstedii TaxID=4781 RepID=A0A0P1ALJ2_PLAHL|nr:Zinc finger, B-box [Plasmopara halstedii]CEG41872.1 Zinc finger, B-box [Plasmopara halstedii]|eukprot:XP_024578241.1 Zinc finger, B-box [Plasmopara halstedii]
MELIEDDERAYKIDGRNCTRVTSQLKGVECEQINELLIPNGTSKTRVEKVETRNKITTRNCAEVHQERVYSKNRRDIDVHKPCNPVSIGVVDRQESGSKTKRSMKSSRLQEYAFGSDRLARPYNLDSAQTKDKSQSDLVIDQTPVTSHLKISTCHRLLTTSEDARDTHVKNIRRKVQLHKSWHDCKHSERNNLEVMMSRTKNHQIVSPKDVLELRSFNLESSSTSVSESHLSKPTKVSTEPLKVNVAHDNEVLVCTFCLIQNAVLWCFSCFTVFCQKCWEKVHKYPVDMSNVSTQMNDLPLWPTISSMNKRNPKDEILKQRVATIEKMMRPGTLVKGLSLTNVTQKRMTPDEKIAIVLPTF